MKKVDGIRVETPVDEKTARSLRAGDPVLLDGVVYTARDMAHQRMCQALEAGQAPPFDLEGAVIYFVGPTPATAWAGDRGGWPYDLLPDGCVQSQADCRGTEGHDRQGLSQHEEVRKALAEYGAVHLSDARRGGGPLEPAHHRRGGGRL